MPYKAGVIVEWSRAPRREERIGAGLGSGSRPQSEWSLSMNLRIRLLN